MKRAETGLEITHQHCTDTFSETGCKSLTQMYISSVFKQLFPSLPPQGNENIVRHAPTGL